MLPPGRWALTPPFHPCLRYAPFEDVPKVFLRAITGIRCAGGIFSVALSVNRSIGFSLCCCACRRVSRIEPTKRHRLKSMLPFPWRYQARCPTSLSRSGVRTFLPPSRLRSQASDRPAHPPISLYRVKPKCNCFGNAAFCESYFAPTNFSNSCSVKIVTPSSLAFSYFDPGSVPTTT
jgi:hypothetical protein